ncbi:MAG: phosphotransferase [Caulobacteraceae bacterium]|nr:phosphotransferase [Caulobacteraceae bacterium]
MALPDIRPPQAIDAPWLTALMQENGVDAVVERVTARPIGTGQIGDSLRFTIDYAHAPDDAPSSLVGKFPSAGEESRATGVRLGNYFREVRFYQQLAPTARIRTPQTWYAEVDEATHDFVLMMEDLAPAQQGDQLEGVSLDQARAVIVEAAKLHASHWGNDRLDALPWVSGSKAAPASAANNEAVVALWQAFKARYGERLPRECADVGDWLAANYSRIASLREGPRCLTHNDFRPDNMMFASAQGGAPVTVLDWQSFAYGVGATDVAYFLAGALPRKTRRKAEPELLALYHRTLTAEGVSGYAEDELARDYARGGYLLFLTGFFAAMIVTQTARGDDMFIQMVTSAAQHMLDHGAVE